MELRNDHDDWSKPALYRRMGCDGHGWRYLLAFTVPAGGYYVVFCGTAATSWGDDRHTRRLPWSFTTATVDRGPRPPLPTAPTHVCKGTVWCLPAGDATGNGAIKHRLRQRPTPSSSPGGTTPNNVVSNVYDRRDTNLDGAIEYAGTGNDRDIIFLRTWAARRRTIRGCKSNLLAIGNPGRFHVLVVAPSDPTRAPPYRQPLCSRPFPALSYSASSAWCRYAPGPN